MASPGIVSGLVVLSCVLLRCCLMLFCPSCNGGDLNLCEPTELNLCVRDGEISSVDTPDGELVEFECDECGELVTSDISLLIPPGC